jgi:hypothetical protein
MRRTSVLVSSLVALISGAVGLQAVEAGAELPAEQMPGSKFTVGQQRQVVIRGLLDFDVVNRGRYLTGNADESDHDGNGNIRAEFGTSVKLDERVKVNITLAYEARSGDNTADSKDVNDRSGFAVVDDAYVEFKEFLGFESVGVLVGRMPVSWNLREDNGAFLYDSAANHPRVTSWDGGRATWNAIDAVDITPFGYSLPGANTLAGVGVDWKPAKSGDSRTFITGMVSYERKPPTREVSPTFSRNSTIVLVDGVPGDKLLTYSGGFDFLLGDVDFYGEFAMQNGDYTSDIKYSGYGGYAGFDWHLYPAQALVVGAEFKALSGNKGNPLVNGGEYSAFVNNWEGVSDTLIVENEQYGELSNLLTGTNALGLQATKLKAGVAFDDRNKVRLNLIYGYYRTAQSTPNDGRSFGQEADLSLAWQYTYNTTIKLFGGGFMPGGAYRAVAPGANPSTDLIYCMGLSLAVIF